MDQQSAPVAVFYQGQAPPAVGGIRKPLKPGGYADSSADITCALQRAGVPVVVPVPVPSPTQDLDWSFPDTTAGIADAVARGATVLWANTVLYAGHPFEAALKAGLALVGQVPAEVTRFDDKRFTNEYLCAAGLPIPAACIVGAYEDASVTDWDELTPQILEQFDLHFPLVVKPIRGRGSQGVQRVATWAELQTAARHLLGDTATYGTAVMLEAYLPGDEVTISLLPPGKYIHHPSEQVIEHHWALPPVLRFNHHEGVAPYNGVVAVTHNSRALPFDTLNADLLTLCQQCEAAAALVGARALIRIDCRQDAQGNWQLFDLNMKPNLTGAGRPGRDDQDSLTTLAAHALGWDYPTLLLSLLDQAWTSE